MPGQAAAAPPAWPAESRIERVADQPILVLFAHPQCPCTRATIGELARLMRRTQGLVQAHVLFVQPDEFTDAWTESDLWRRAAAIPGVHVLRDPGGREAHRYGAATSGQVLLYDEAGRLRFSGGITGSRGHEGDNAGRQALESMLTAGSAAQPETFVFGCPLTSKHAACTKGTCSYSSKEVKTDAVRP